jgi:hypothetical protein
MALTSCITASWVVTASSRTVASSTRRVLAPIAPVASTTARTASKIRSGCSLARSLLRHKVSTVGWNPSSSSESPAATFQAMFVRSWCAASRSERPSKAWSTITVATTSAGTDGRPRPDGNRSAKYSSANSAFRYSAKNAFTEPPGTR